MLGVGGATRKLQGRQGDSWFGRRGPRRSSARAKEGGLYLREAIGSLAAHGFGKELELLEGERACEG